MLSFRSATLFSPPSRPRFIALTHVPEFAMRTDIDNYAPTQQTTTVQKEYYNRLRIGTQASVRDIRATIGNQELIISSPSKIYVQPTNYAVTQHCLRPS